MAIIEDFFQKVVDITSKICEVENDSLFSSNREPYVNARCLIIIHLADKGYSDIYISRLTGLTRQAVNHIRNTFPSRLKQSWMLKAFHNQIGIELEKKFQRDSNELFEEQST